VKLTFAKYQGTGNDFVVVDGLDGLPVIDWPAVTSFLCDRHYGIGADGVLLVTRGEAAPFAMRVLNADGSEPEMCGNGIRCVARYLYDRGLVAAGAFDVETGAGVIRPEVLPDLQVRVDMGVPRLTRAEIPMSGPAGERVIEEPLGAGFGTVLVTAVSMGNPHAIVFVPDVDAIPLADWGPRIERHEDFPDRTNVEFVQVMGRSHANMRVWERGSGATLACGTGACATLVAGVLAGRMDREATIHLPGGPLAIRWDADDHVWLTGPADPVFTGEVALPSERREAAAPPIPHSPPTS
jgi:diaminopimelate epimerase